MCQNQLWGEDCEAGLYDRIAVKKAMLTKQNDVKRYQWVKVHKDWTINQWIKSFVAKEDLYLLNLLYWK